MADDICAILRRSGRLVFADLFFEQQQQQQLQEAVQTVFTVLGVSDCWESFYYCLRELCTNAQKSLLKRLHFEEAKLDITSSSDYDLGMANFKTKVLNNAAPSQQKLLERGAFIEVSFTLLNGLLQLQVQSQGVLCQPEQQRIAKRLQLARVSEQISDVQQDICDESEGAGLGLVMVGLILKKMGCSSDGFTIVTGDGLISAHVQLQIKHLNSADLGAVNESLIQAIESLPNLPENILSLQNLMRSPNVDFQQIAVLIERDHSLTAELLRLVNSVIASPNSRIISVRRAVVLLGLDGLEQLMLTVTVERLLKLRSQKKLWQHSRDCARLTQLLLSLHSNSKELFSLGYVAGLLHDIGDIILLDNAKSMHAFFEQLQHQHPEITFKTLDFIQSGYSHVELGSLLAKKWRFPKVLEQVIHFHHNPMAAPLSVRYLTACIYMADLFLNYVEGDIPRVYLRRDLLQLLKLEGEQQLYMCRDLLLMRLEQEKQD